MKLRNTNLILIALAAAFLLFAAGFCVGRLQTDGNTRVITMRQPAAVSESATQAMSSTEETAAMQQGAKLDLNTATAEELMTLPGIGEVLAGRIVAYRAAHGSFSSIDELAQEAGIGEKRIDDIRDYVTLGGTE